MTACLGEAEANLRGMLGGILSLQLACLMPASWNQVASWLKQIDKLRQAA
jgi:hypothetical protein